MDAVPKEILDAAVEATRDLIPQKSKPRYEKAYQDFKLWQIQNHVDVITEDVMLAYFKNLSQAHKTTSLWVYYSMLRCTIGINENVDLKTFHKLYAFLKRLNVGVLTKKAKVLTNDDVWKFLIEAADEEYLFHKVALMFGFFGACRCDEIYQLRANDVKNLH